MNKGKKFEEDFKKSVPESTFLLRLKDSGGWSNADNTRFTPKNLCDFVLFAGNMLYLLELKSHKGKLIPVSNFRQVDKMASIKHVHVEPCFLLNYRDHEQTYIIHALEVQECLKHRKSVNIEYCQEKGFLVPQKLRRTRYRYDLSIMGVKYENV